MAFDTPPTAAPIPASFGELYAKWRSIRRVGPLPLIEFVAWVETTMGKKICDLMTDEDMDALHRQMLVDSGDQVGEMLWQGLEGGP
jgi:hypothetical protein